MLTVRTTDRCFGMQGMANATLLTSTLQRARRGLKIHRLMLEDSICSEWNAATSKGMDACLHLDAAIVEFLATLELDHIAPCITVPDYLRPDAGGGSCRGLPFSVGLSRSPRRIRTHEAQQDSHDFESVGSIIPRTMDMIDEAALSRRRTVRR